MTLPADAPHLPNCPDLWLSTLSWQPDAHQQSQFQQLYAGILEGNRQLNLTRITDPIDFWEKHLWDSLRGIQPWLQNADRVEDGSIIQNSKFKIQNSSHLSVIDIGTGAGFPGLPVAIAQPTWTVTVLDSTRKKIEFLKHLLAALKLSNVQTLVERAEPVGQSLTYRETFDLALIRAVATAPVCAEYALPLLKIGGVAVLYRGQWTPEENAQLNQAVDLLGGTVEQVDQFVTPISHSDRTCLYLRKVAATPPTYPRAIGIPSQKPLPIHP
ncbi:MAG: 16S rRNA (guanine(527)-N(7))-methyltransferase RsmG [Leptolyngbyaceae cyanobacterium]